MLEGDSGLKKETQRGTILFAKKYLELFGFGENPLRNLVFEDKKDELSCNLFNFRIVSHIIC